MGKFSEALKKAAKDRLDRIEKKEAIKPYIIKSVTDSKVDPHITTFFDSHSPITEQYRILRTNIQAINPSSPPRIFAMTSSIHNEGKTVTTINLAITLANDLHKKRILLVDADLRKRSLTNYLGINSEFGLSDMLSDGETVESMLVNIGINNLDILPSGNPKANPAELLSSPKMKKTLAELKKQYDYIVFDCPPVIPVTDGVVVGAQCDGVVVVIQAARTQRGTIRHAQDLLKQARVKTLGYVLTSIEYHIPQYIYRYL